MEYTVTDGAGFNNLPALEAGDSVVMQDGAFAEIDKISTVKP